LLLGSSELGLGGAEQLLSWGELLLFYGRCRGCSCACGRGGASERFLADQRTLVSIPAGSAEKKCVRRLKRLCGLADLSVVLMGP